MKKLQVLAGIALLAIPFVSKAQTNNFVCPSDWNCFPKTITACPIGYVCIRYSDNFRIETQNIAKNVQENTPAQVKSLADQISDMVVTIKQNQTSLDTINITINKIETGAVIGPDILTLPSLKSKSNYLSCLIGDEYNQVSFLQKGLDPVNRPNYNCTQ